MGPKGNQGGDYDEGGRIPRKSDRMSSINFDSDRNIKDPMN